MEGGRSGDALGRGTVKGGMKNTGIAGRVGTVGVYQVSFKVEEVCARGNRAEGAAGRKGKGVEVGRTGGIAKVVVVGTVGYHVQVYHPGAILEVYCTGAVNGHGTELQAEGNGSGAGCLQRSAAAYVNIEQAEVGVGSCSAKGGCSVGKGANKVVAGSAVGVLHIVRLCLFRPVTM